MSSFSESARIRGKLAAFLAVGLCICAVWSQAAALGPKGKGKSKKDIDVLFSPNGGCTARIVKEIGRAKDAIRLQAFFFTSEPIADALVDAHERGVRVVAIFDKSQEKQRYSRLRILRRAGITVKIDAKHATANNKIILIDNKTIMTGSLNFTKAAEEKNAENLLIIKGYPRLFAEYLDNFERHLEHSRDYSG
ncbi:MAG: phospholipase D family protein [Phycisphaerales bacterium]|nr:phospholipase D family protein [Phycisphaerales bacterium]